MNAFAGTGILLRLALRRDRLLLPIWIIVFAGMAAISASATVGLYPDPQSRVVAAEAANSTASLVAFYGRLYDPTSLGELSMLKMSVLGSAMVAILTIIVMVRHTRAEEESSRLELVEAGGVGRFAALTAAMLVCLITCAALGLLTALGLAAAGLPVAGSLAFGAMWALVGLVFATVAGVAAQLARSARAATGLSLAVLLIAYLMRAVADMSEQGSLSWLSYLSPLGLGQQVRAFAGNRWWVAGVLLVIAVALTGLAFILTARRDFGAGVLTDRPGPAHAGATLAGPFGLAWHLQRSVLVTWLAAMLVLGGVLGNSASSISGLVDSDQMREFFRQLGGAGALTDAFLAAEMSFIAFAAAAYGIQAALRLRSEESQLHAEQLLATGVGRTRWALSHVVIALIGAALILAVAGAATGLAHAAQVGDPSQVGRLIGAALAHLPAAWVLVGVVMLLFGFVPRLATGAWGLLVAFILLAEIVPLLKWNQTIMDVSPFTHIPLLPGASFTAFPLLVLTVVTAVLIGGGLLGFERRDVD